MGFKVQKKYQEITHFYLSSHHGKINLGLKVLDLNQRPEFKSCTQTNKQNNNILKLTNYTKTKCIQLKKMTNKIQNKQTNKKKI